MQVRSRAVYTDTVFDTDSFRPFPICRFQSTDIVKVTNILYLHIVFNR